jgi:invasion protein IalB
MPAHHRRLASLLAVAIVGMAAAPCIAAPKGAKAEKPPEIAARGQKEARDVAFGDWQKLCFKAGGAPKLCRTSITGKFPTGQTAVRIDLIEREDAPTARLQLFVPIGMYLQQPPRLTIDKGLSQQLPYSWCLTNMCIAAEAADRQFVKAMDSGTTLVLDVVDSNLVTVTTSVPLAQFATVHKGAPAKTLEQEIEE